MSIFDYSVVLYMHASSSTLKPLVVYPMAVFYIKKWAGPLTIRREQYCLLFIYKAGIGKAPNAPICTAKFHQSIISNSISQTHSTYHSTYQ